MSLTVTIRSARSGRKITSFSMDDAQQAHNVAETLMQSSAWASCNAVCTDGFGNIVFELSHVSRREPVVEFVPEPVTDFTMATPTVVDAEFEEVCESGIREAFPFREVQS